MDSTVTFRYPGRGAEGGRPIREGGTSYHMCKTGTLNSKVLVLEPGVHNDLHAHSDEDAHYFVLSGRVTFYGEGNKVVADLLPNDGVFVPHDRPYWFASCGELPLELLRVSTPAAPDGRS